MKTKLLLIATLLGLLSCSGDDESNASQSEMIIGTWKYVGYTFDGNESIPPQEEYADTPCGYWATDTFTANGIAIYQDFDEECNEVGSADSEGYSVEGGYLIYHTSDEGDIVFKIENLTNSQLIISDEGEHLIYNK